MRNPVIERLIAEFGGVGKAATALGVAQPTVTGWRLGHHGMRAGVAIRAERLTNGRIKASELCPELAGFPIDSTTAAA
jgi:DNA-binding transcriptional regulator YdaS (Cro superfamily)